MQPKKKKQKQAFFSMCRETALYQRFTESGMMDFKNDFLIGKNFWDFLGGENTFSALLEIFDEVGKEFKEKLNKKFRLIAKEKITSY